MKTYNKLTILLLSLTITATFGCNKFLDEKTNKNQVIPSTLKDAQALLDYNPTIIQSDVGATEASTDDYYITDERYLATSENFRRMYTWEKSNLFAPDFNDWSNLYNQIYIANTVLEVVKKNKRTEINASEWDNNKGQALFFRSHFLLQAAFIWCRSYDSSTAANDIGLPLRLNTNFNEKSQRSSLADTYNRIVNDLLEAIDLLPNIQKSVTRPSKAAAYALLARTYLSMRNYKEVGKYAGLSLGIKNDLLDYSKLNKDAAFPIVKLNEEVLFESRMSTPELLFNENLLVNQSLYDSYASNDLRKSCLFRKNIDNSYGFKGSYEGGGTYFTGISVNEVYLMRAEAFARENKTIEAMEDLNTLLYSRWSKNTSYVEFNASNANDALSQILTERRKELLFRGLRWMDIKRLNKEGYQINLSRTVNGKIYTLSHDDSNFVLPIPEDVIATSGMQQNP